MKKLTYLLFLAMGVTACSVESIDSTENLLVADAKLKIQQVEKSMSLKVEEICEGDAPVFVFTFPEAFNGPNATDTDIRISVETAPGSGEWLPVKTLSYSGAGPKEYTLEGEPLAIGTYSYRAQIAGGNPGDHTATLNVVPCGCEESFSYVENENGSYTFTYVPAEDMDDAHLVFTLAQSDSDTGLEGWEDNGATKQKTMDLAACQVYTWTVTLSADCNGNQPNSQAWTDFTVNGESKKNGNTPNIVKSCN